MQAELMQLVECCSKITAFNRTVPDYFKPPFLFLTISIATVGLIYINLILYFLITINLQATATQGFKSLFI